MILLDTNVISEPLKKHPAKQVIAWLDLQPVETLYLSAITTAEIRFGIASLPAGKRRSDLHQRVEDEVFALFSDRILSFNSASSVVYASIMAKAQNKGLAISMADGLIAATALTNQLSVATRDTHPFEAAGVKVINPWHS